MRLGLVIRGVMSVPGVLLVMVVRVRVVITGGRGGARMGKQRKGVCPPTPWSTTTCMAVKRNARRIPQLMKRIMDKD